MTIATTQQKPIIKKKKVCILYCNRCHEEFPGTRHGGIVERIGFTFGSKSLIKKCPICQRTDEVIVRRLETKLVPAYHG